MAEEVAYLRNNRYCSVHGTDLVPPDRTLRTRRYCNQCPPGSVLGFPAWMVDDEAPPRRWSPCLEPCCAELYRIERGES